MKTNKEILHMAGRKQIALVGLVKERKIKYFGHVKRHQSLLKDVLEGRVEGSRPRGRTQNQLGRECQELEWTKTARVHQNGRR